MKIVFNKNLQVTEITSNHSDKTGKDYFKVSCLDTSNGEFIKLPISEVNAHQLVLGQIYNFSIACESFYDEPSKISAFRLRAYSFANI